MGQNDKATVAVPPRKREIRAWASGSNAPLSVCPDARLRGGKEWKDATYGQAGWDWGINFANFQDLVQQLQGGLPSETCGNWWFDCDPLKDGELLALAINCHGASGIVDIDCGCTNSSMLADASTASKPFMEVASLPRYAPQFDVLKRLLHPDHGVLFFMCCMTGQLAKGSEFLIAVSKLLPGRDVMAIATVGYSNGGAMMRPGNSLGEPGMRDTTNPWPAPTGALEDARYATTWGDLAVLPWASRMSPHTKVARDGAITGGAGASM